MDFYIIPESNDKDDMIPKYDEYHRIYRFADGREMTDKEYETWCYEEHNKKELEQLEHKLKCIESTELMNDMLKGYAPSIAYSRAYRRKIKMKKN